MSADPKKSRKKASGLITSAGIVTPLSNVDAPRIASLPIEAEGRALETPMMIELDKIDRSPYQNRVTPSSEAVAALAAELKTNGLNSPVIVRPKAGGRFELVAGETRVAAFRHNAETAIPAFVRSMTDGEAARKLVADNFFHAEMSDWEIYKGLVTAKNALEMDGMGAALSDLASLTPWGKSHVHRLLSFGRLPSEALESLEAAAASGAPPLRARAAAELAAMLESGCPNNAVTQAVKEVLSGHCDQIRAPQRAKAIAEGQGTPKPKNPYNPNVRAISSADGRLVFTLQRLPKGVTIKGAKGEDFDSLESDLLAFLESRVATKD